MGLARLFGICAAILFASSVGAVTVDVGPSDFRNFGPNGSHTGSGIKSTFTQQVRLPPTVSGPTRILPVSRNPIVPYASAAARMRPFTSIHPASAAASAAITAMFLAMEWYFDEEIGEWSVREVESVPPIEGTGWRISGGTAACTYVNTGADYPTPAAACEFAMACQSPPRTSYEVSGIGPGGALGSMAADCTLNPGGRVVKLTTPGLDCPSGTEFNPVEGVCQAYQSRPVIEGEFSRLSGELPSMPAERVAQGTGDAQRRGGVAPGYSDTQMTGPNSVAGPETTSTSTDPVTGDVTVTNTSTQTNISYGDTTITTNTTTTSTNYQNGQETSTTVTTETPGELPVDIGGGGVSGDWPGFCDWATVVCDWLLWTQEDPPEDLDLPPVIDDDFFEQKRISFGAKSCPPDHEINLAPFLETTVGVSFQPLCDFAGLIYYMVMMASYIIAAYISIGVARNA